MMAAGLGRMLARRQSAILLIVNYHRLRETSKASVAQFDDGVFGPDVETFRRQMQWLRSSTNVLDEAGLLRVGSGDALPRGKVFSAVTFDDGYIDCYTLAKPILDELGIRGIFFLPVEMLESRRLGWWDIAAYLLKRTRKPAIVLWGQTYDLAVEFPRSLRQILNLFKLEKAERTEGLLSELSEACAVTLPSQDEQSAELMNWAQVRELKNSGHAIGSHTLSHRVLATLDVSAQAWEIRESKRELEAIIGSRIVSFAYPVGGPAHFNDDSARLAQEAGYEQAFTFNTGMTSLPVTDRFRIPRESANSFAVLKAKALLPRVMGVPLR